jgi:hypothetical protein
MAHRRGWLQPKIVLQLAAVQLLLGSMLNGMSSGPKRQAAMVLVLVLVEYQPVIPAQTREYQQARQT